MIYREYLVMRKALAWFAGLLLAIMLIVLTFSKSTSIGYAGIANGSGWLAAIFASIFGVALGNGSREAARVLWVLPTQRWKLALQVIAVDLVGTTVAFAWVYLLSLTFAGLHFGVKILGALSATDMAMALATAYGAYGWSTIAGMLGRRMAYCGIIALPALMIWMILAQSQIALGTILRAPIVANPFAVYNAGLILEGWSHHRFTLDPIASSLQWLGTAWEMPVLVAIAVGTCGLAVALWQRSEAIY
jgi:hypothetical protein